MAQDSDNSNHTVPPVTSSDSMSPGKESNGGDETKSNIHLGAVSGIDKGKGIVNTGGEDEIGRSKGEINTPHIVAAARDGRSGEHHGDTVLRVTAERERRKRVNELFTRLHGLLPALPNKVKKSRIVMEAIHYIKSLEGTLSELENRKLQMQLARGKVGAVANNGESSSAVAQTPTNPVALAPIVQPGNGIWLTGPTSAPTGTVGTVTMASAPVGLQTWSGPNIVLSVSGNNACINVCVARRPGVLTMVMAVLEKHNIDVVTLGISSDNTRSICTINARINRASNQFGGSVLSEEIYKLAVSEMMNNLAL